MKRKYIRDCYPILDWFEEKYEKTDDENDFVKIADVWRAFTQQSAEFNGGAWKEKEQCTFANAKFAFRRDHKLSRYAYVGDRRKRIDEKVYRNVIL